MDIYPAVNFIWKWARLKRGVFLSFCTTVIIVMYAVFKVNPIVAECTCTFYVYLFILFILSLMLTITEQILFTIKNSNKMLIDVNTLVKKPIEHKTCYI